MFTEKILPLEIRIFQNLILKLFDRNSLKIMSIHVFCVRNSILPPIFFQNFVNLGHMRKHWRRWCGVQRQLLQNRKQRSESLPKRRRYFIISGFYINSRDFDDNFHFFGCLKSSFKWCVCVAQIVYLYFPELVLRCVLRCVLCVRTCVRMCEDVREDVCWGVC